MTQLTKSQTEVQNGQPTPDLLIMKAVESGNIDAIERLMDLKERYDRKQAEKAYRQAMSNFQSEKPDLKKTAKVDVALKTGGRMKYNFNPLPRIQKAIDPVLSKFGLSYRWEQEQENGKIKITCIVSHIDGHSEKTWLMADSDTSGSKNAIQGIGSTVSYLKRYTLEGALGLSSDDDDDGKAAPDKQKEPGITAGKKERPEAIDVLSKEYMKLYDELTGIVGDGKASQYHPDNWGKEPTVGRYNYGIKAIRSEINKHRK